MYNILPLRRLSLWAEQGAVVNPWLKYGPSSFRKFWIKVDRKLLIIFGNLLYGIHIVERTIQLLPGVRQRGVQARQFHFFFIFTGLS